MKTESYFDHARKQARSSALAARAGEAAAAITIVVVMVVMVSLAALLVGVTIKLFQSI